MAKKKTAEKAKIEAAPVLRAGGGGGDDPVITKSYSMRDDWIDKGVVNTVAFKSVDGEVDTVLVNGEPAGGGGGDFSIAQVSSSNNTGSDIELTAGVPIIEDEEFYTRDYLVAGDETLSIVLYKGGPSVFTFETVATVTVTGSIDLITFGQTQKEIHVTGNGTITIS